MSSVGQEEVEPDYAKEREEYAAMDAHFAAERKFLSERGLPVPAAGVPEIAEEQLDLVAVWRGLSEADRETVGLIGLGLVVGGTIAAEAEAFAPRAARAGLAFYRAVEDELAMTPPPEGVLAALRGPSWRIPAGLGPVCKSCGCSEGDACPGGCGWTDASQCRCTACASRPSYDSVSDIPY
ncbi:hypothetical protein LPC10_17475 [Methylorubrum sp. B1-46]|uniref:hypothetical protein n=1 Tax=Methylorubrum TaxID=2282523 RepID=UPI001E34491A|nr:MULTISPECIES: hypothetical protein [Methylorubrum]MCG5246917.1 hypothetical protein [Methylorubrum extorquens]UGB24724.1 hypothetical protein LPC10_17475 [Methylorubrum sp. B1-46]